MYDAHGFVLAGQIIITIAIIITSVLGRRAVVSCQPKILFHQKNLSGTNPASCMLAMWSNQVIQIPNRELGAWLQHLLTVVTGF